MHDGELRCFTHENLPHCHIRLRYKRYKKETVEILTRTMKPHKHILDVQVRLD